MSPKLWRDGQCVQLLRDVLPSTGQPIALLQLQPRGEGSKKGANLLSQALCAELAAHLAALQTALAEEDSAARPALLVVYSALPRSFCHGADIALQRSLQAQQAEASEASDAAAAAAVDGLKQLLDALEQLPIASLAVLHGAALGGGLELALACSYRVALAPEDLPAQLGLPEVKLGLLPAAGGCVRLPRLIGLTPALGMLLPGRMLGADEARRIGLVDAVLSANPAPEQWLPLLDQQHWRRGALLRPPARKYPRLWTASTWVEQQLIYRGALRQLDRSTSRRYPAPYVCLRTVMRAWNQPLPQAMATETAAYLQLLRTPEAASLMAVFVARSDIKQRAWQPVREAGLTTDSDEAAEEPVVLIVGAGHMGAGIGQHLAAQGVQVTLYDISDEVLQAAKRRIEHLFQSAVKKRKMTAEKAAERQSNITYVSVLDPAGFEAAAAANQLPVVIEAVPEDLALKQELVEKILSATKRTVFATNTSSLPIANVAARCGAPDRVIGLHFFHPEGDVTPCAEVIRGPASSLASMRAALQIAARMNKVPVLVGDVPGFVMNRVAGAFYAMAGHLLVYGAGSVRRIDRVMTDMGFAAGPFAILDGITLPTALKVGEWLFKQVSDRGSAALLVLLRAMLAVGWKGRSPSGSSRGFYTWQNGRQQAVNEEIKSLAQRVRSEMAAAENRAAGGDMLRTLRVPQLSDDDVRDALLLAMLNESCNLLEAGVAQAPMDIDFLTVASMGLAPAWGGILSWGDKYGLKRAVERTKELAAKLHLPELKPSPRLQAEAAKGGVLRPDLPATGAPRGAGEQPKLAPAGPSYVEAAVVALLGAAAFHIISGRSSKL